MNKIDPQKEANRIIEQVRKGFTREYRHPGLSGRALWTMIGELGLAMEKSASQPESPRKTSKRMVADLMKVSAILQDTAAQHGALERCDDPASQGDAVSRLIKSIMAD